MSVDIHTARPNDRVVDVIRKMGDKQVRRIPVVNENGYLVGMISMADIAVETQQDHELSEAIEEISKGRRSGIGCLDRSVISRTAIADCRLPMPIFQIGILAIGNRQSAFGPLHYLHVFTYSLAMRNTNRDFSLIRTDRRVVPSGRLWNPAADVYRVSEGWVVKVDLAGICSDELEIEIRDSLLDYSWLSTRHTLS